MTRYAVDDPKRPLMPVELICQADGLPMPTPEFRFDPDRRWRFDYAWIAQLVALEIEGAVWTGGRHTRGAGFLKDMDKYNRAAELGWLVFRCTPNTIHLEMPKVTTALQTIRRRK